jgi:hypothetical protein
MKYSVSSYGIRSVQRAALARSWSQVTGRSALAGRMGDALRHEWGLRVAGLAGQAAQLQAAAHAAQHL